VGGKRVEKCPLLKQYFFKSPYFIRDFPFLVSTLKRRRKLKVQIKIELKIVKTEVQN